MANKLQSSITRKNGEGEASWIRRIINACATDIRYITSLFKTSYSGEFIDGDGNTVTVVEGVITTVEAPTTLTLTWNDINNAMYTDVADYNTALGSDFTTLTADGNDQLLSGNTTSFALNAIFNTNINLVSIEDTANSIVSLDNAALKDCISLKTVSLPLCTYLGDETFVSCTSLTSVNIPLCEDLGSSVLNDGVFEYISGQTITLTIAASRATCNGGNPDGDIVYLVSNNTATIIYV